MNTQDSNTHTTQRTQREPYDGESEDYNEFPYDGYAEEKRACAKAIVDMDSKAATLTLAEKEAAEAKFLEEWKREITRAIETDESRPTPATTQRESHDDQTGGWPYDEE